MLHHTRLEPGFTRPGRIAVPVAIIREAYNAHKAYYPHIDSIEICNHGDILKFGGKIFGVSNAIEAGVDFSFFIKVKKLIRIFNHFDDDELLAMEAEAGKVTFKPYYGLHSKKNKIVIDVETVHLSSIIGFRSEACYDQLTFYKTKAKSVDRSLIPILDILSHILETNLGFELRMRKREKPKQNIIQVDRDEAIELANELSDLLAFSLRQIKANKWNLHPIEDDASTTLAETILSELKPILSREGKKERAETRKRRVETFNNAKKHHERELEYLNSRLSILKRYRGRILKAIRTNQPCYL